RLETICIAFMQLGDRVNAALRTQIGDRVRLHEQNSGVLRMLEAIQQGRLTSHLFCLSLTQLPQHSDVIPAAERQVMEVSVDAMIQALATAAVQLEDLPHGPAVQVTYQEPTGHRGRPRIEIDYNFLAYGLELRGPTGLAPVADVSSRTIRRRALEYGLVEPAAPVYTETIDEATGEVIRMYTSSTTGPVSMIADDDLNQLMHLILEIFPTFGRRMIAGNLRGLGHRVPTSWIRLRRWCIIIHAFIDGYSRFVTGIRANNNNRAATVLELFLEEVLQHGTPRRLLSGWRLSMVLSMGHTSGAGDVHNIRIERLWCDVTRGFGRKWSNFFHSLELSCDLRP
ncbi:hypothetical protein B0H19DRAFT_899411, partial [Mycena capillaripes]